MQTKKGFVIAPIGKDDSLERKRLDTIIENVLTPVLKDTYEITAAHQIKEPGVITSQIVETIFDSDLIIADLTNINGNVMYELAIAHLKEKKVIIIANKDTIPPFDVSHNRIIFYEDNIYGSFELQKNLRDTINKLNTGNVSAPKKETVEKYNLKYNKETELWY